MNEPTPSFELKLPAKKSRYLRWLAVFAALLAVIAGIILIVVLYSGYTRTAKWVRMTEATEEWRKYLDPAYYGSYHDTFGPQPSLCPPEDAATVFVLKECDSILGEMSSVRRCVFRSLGPDGVISTYETRNDGVEYLGACTRYGDSRAAPAAKELIDRIAAARNIGVVACRRADDGFQCLGLTAEETAEIVAAVGASHEQRP